MREKFCQEGMLNAEINTKTFLHWKQTCALNLGPVYMIPLTRD